MCGIAGIVDPALNVEGISTVLQRMTNAIIHRGPDDCGTVVRNGAGIGMRRLSIIDVAGGHQPIANETGEIHVICNGEIYNFHDLRSDLQQRGHHFSTKSDAEVVVHLYEEYGDDCLIHLRGMFGLAIWDERTRRLLIARDRLGKKPLFYSQRGDQLWFGSEMKSLLAANPQLAVPDYRNLGVFFQHGFIGQPDSIYKAIHRLPAGSYGVFQNGMLAIKPYWSLKFEPDSSVREEEWLERLDHLLTEAVRIRLVSEVPLGVFLSGGIDSSAVVAYAHRAGLKPLKTFTIGFDRPEWDESDDAARVAAHFGTEHHRLQLSEAHMASTFEETLLAIARHCDEPFGDASALPTYHVSRLAREHVTVILSGDGGDELFAGYSSYRGAVFAQKYRRRVPYWLGRFVLPGLVQGAAKLLTGSKHYQMLRVARVLRDSALPIDEAYREKTSIWKQAEIRELLQADVVEQLAYMGEQKLPDELARIMRSDRDLVSRLCEVDIRSYMLDDILVKVDRMSMAHSLEVRSPLLDHNVVELAARMPTEMKLRGSVGKYVLRQVVKKHLPPETMQKPKQGFSVPLRDWFRGRLRSTVQDYLGSGGYLPKELFSSTKIAKILDEHQRGTVDHANKIWLLLSFAAWHRQYQQGAQPTTDENAAEYGSMGKPAAGVLS